MEGIWFIGHRTDGVLGKLIVEFDKRTTNFSKQCELQALITERQAMIAENQHCKYLGWDATYHEDDLKILADKFRKLGGLEEHNDHH